MGNKQSKQTSNSFDNHDKIQTLQKYHGAKSPLKHTPGVDKVLRHWIRNKTSQLIPRDLFLLILNFLSNFDEFEFQKNHLWTTKRIESVQGTIYQTVHKNQGQGCHYNILFGAILTGEIEFECKVIFSRYNGHSQRQHNSSSDRHSYRYKTVWNDVQIGKDAHDTKYVDRLSIGLVEPNFHQFTEQNMHLKSKHKRCVFRKDAYFDCNGQRNDYEDAEFDALRGRIQFDICVNMKKRTFCITDANGHCQIIADIPDQRVLCFEVWDCKTIYVGQQKLKWV